MTWPFPSYRRSALGRLGARALVAWLAWAGAAKAAPARVALVHERDPSALEQKTLTRLRAELVAAGFEVVEIERQGEDSREAAEAEPGVSGVFATIAVVPRTGNAADIWVADRVTGKTAVRRVEASGPARDMATVLAVRAVELLQASLLEAVEPPPRSDPDKPPEAPPPPVAPLPSDVSAWMRAHRPPSEPSSPTHFALQAGVGVLHSFGGIGPAFLPMIGLFYRFSSELSAGLHAGGPAFASDLQAIGGTIAVRQELVDLEAVYEFLPPDSMVRPMVIAGVGAYHLDVVGAASPPYKGESNDLWAAHVVVGPGAKLQLGRRVSLLGDLRFLVIAPQPVVRAAGTEAGNMSRPSLLGELVVDVTF